MAAKKIFSFIPLLLGGGGIFWILLFILSPQSLRLNLFGEEWQWPFYIRVFIPFSIIGSILGIVNIKLKIDKFTTILGFTLSLVSLILWLLLWFWITAWGVGG